MVLKYMILFLCLFIRSYNLWVISIYFKMISSWVVLILCNIWMYSSIYMPRYNINTRYLCPKHLNFSIQGNDYASTFSYIEITINKWNGTKWRTLKESNEAISDNKLELIMINTYFDYDDYTSPVKKII